MTRLALITIAFILAVSAPVQTTAQEVPQNQIESFDVICVVGGVRLEWTMIGEVGITQYHLVKDAIGIAIVPSQCPGCVNGASYSYDYETYTPNGVYMLIPDINSATVTVTDCDVATVVTLASFEAVRKPFCQWTGRYPAYACFCNGKITPFSFLCGKKPR